MEMLDMVNLAGLSQRYPHELSGGQQQRIALARALAPSPKVMLLDEPFSNLDADLRMELRTETKRILKEKGTTTILVTHDQEEAFSLSDRVGVLNNGRLEQIGTPEDIYHRSLTRFVANFVGRADFIGGRIEGDSVISDIGIFKYGDAIPRNIIDIDLMIRPDDVDVIADHSGDATVVDAQFLGAEIIYKLMLHNGEIIHSIKPSTNIIGIGSRVRISIDPAHIIVFPKGGDD
jgi:iron(III) transport system ATP-binding protein